MLNNRYWEITFHSAFIRCIIRIKRTHPEILGNNLYQIYGLHQGLNIKRTHPEILGNNESMQLSRKSRIDN